MKLIDISGRRFGKLLVIRKEENVGSCRRWLCKCDCGKEKYIDSRGLTRKNGGTKSCGCHTGEYIRESHITHGQSRIGSHGTKTYRTWRGMLARCYYEKDIAYKNYGARGIKVCERWHSFENFYMDVGEPPSDSRAVSIDRLNVNKDYGPDNWRWSNPKEQARNRRSNILLTVNGVTKTCLEWGEQSGVLPDTIRKRLKSGWSVKKAITVPPKNIRRKM